MPNQAIPDNIPLKDFQVFCLFKFNERKMKYKLQISKCISDLMGFQTILILIILNKIKTRCKFVKKKY